MKTKQIKRRTLLSAYDNCDKYTLLEWLKCLAKELEATQLKITKANEGEGILLTFTEDGELDKINAKVTEADINALASELHELEIEVDGKQTKLRAGQNITIYHDEETGEDVINATGGGSGVELLVKAKYSNDSYVVQTSGLYEFLYSFWGAERRTPNVVMTITNTGRIADNETIHFTNSERIRLVEQEDYNFKFYARIENSEEEDAYYLLEVNDDASTLSKIVYSYQSEIEDLQTNKQDKESNALTTESKQIVGAINEHDVKINTHNTRLNGIDNDIIQLESTKQDKSDEDLSTISKNIVGAINEVNAKAEGGEGAYVISTANGKNPNFVSENYEITATQIELQDGTIVPIADISVGKSIYVLEEAVSDRWYSGNGKFIRLQEKTILDDYQLIATLDDDVEDLGYLKSVSFSIITGSVSDNVALSNAFLQKENKLDLDTDVGNLGYIKGITQDDLLELLSGSKFISIDEDEETEKLVVSFDFTNIDEFITFASGQDIVASWTEDKELQLNLSNTLKNKINNSLQLPTTHTEETLVGVDTTGGQEQVKLDAETMEIVDGRLKAKAKPQEQADWNETDNTKPSYIKNKPTIPSEIHLYEHHLRLVSQSSEPLMRCYAVLSIITTSSDQIRTYEQLSQYITAVNCSGVYMVSNNTYPVMRISEGNIVYATTPTSEDVTQIMIIIDTVRRII